MTYVHQTGTIFFFFFIELLTGLITVECMIAGIVSVRFLIQHKKSLREKNKNKNK